MKGHLLIVISPLSSGKTRLPLSHDHWLAWNVDIESATKTPAISAAILNNESENEFEIIKPKPSFKKHVSSLSIAADDPWLFVTSVVRLMTIDSGPWQTAPDGLPGQTAPDGLPGQTAPDGLPGQTAPDGLPGQTAPDGLPGQTAPDGLPGQTAPDGVPGQTAPDGLPGQTAPDGLPGQTALDGLPTLYYVNTSSPRQNDRYLADDIFKCIFLDENAWISIKISLEFVPNGTIFHHCFRLWLAVDQATSHYLNQWWLDYWHIYASLCFGKLMAFANASLSLKVSQPATEVFL